VGEIKQKPKEGTRKFPTQSQKLIAFWEKKRNKRTPPNDWRLGEGGKFGKGDLKNKKRDGRGTSTRTAPIVGPAQKTLEHPEL